MRIMYELSAVGICTPSEYTRKLFHLERLYGGYEGATQRGHSNTARDSAVPDGLYVASSSWDHAVQIWAVPAQSNVLQSERPNLGVAEFNIGGQGKIEGHDADLAGGEGRIGHTGNIG